MIKVIIIEDERPSARRLGRMLSGLNIEAQAMLHSVKESVEWFKTNEHPDLILLDIQLSDGLSFEIFEEVSVNSAIIFTTAYEDYAINAIRHAALDYLLKPINYIDLMSSIKRFEDNRAYKQLQLW